MLNNNNNLFKNLTYEKFKSLAEDKDLNPIEKVGFPIGYRENKEKSILNDIIFKLDLKDEKSKVILDIGCGCSNLTILLIEFCRLNNHTLILIDSKEMLDNLPDEDFIIKIEGYFPNTCNDFIELHKNKIDYIIVYSVIQYVFNELSIFNFIDSSCALLNESGKFIIGDIPNISKRKRFFSSENGVEFHKRFIGTDEVPEVCFNNIEFNSIDDSVIFSIIQRCRISGFDAYVLPQGKDLPMANRREDILIIKP